MRLKTDDLVEIISGADTGTRGKVLRIIAVKRRVVVEGVNRVRKHVKRSQRNPRGGQLSKEMPVSIANVMVVCSSCGKPARQGARFLDDGTKERYCKKCGAGTGEIAPARAAHAKAT